MIKQVCLFLSCIAPLTYAVEETCVENLKMASFQENAEALKKATHRYLHFINKISQGEVFPQMEVAEGIISPNCKKILNGRLLSQNREDFVSDLLFIYENQGAWKVSPVDIIVDSSGSTVVLRIFIESLNLGTYTAMVILRYDSSYLITEINEVLSLKDSFDFKEDRGF